MGAPIVPIAVQFFAATDAPDIVYTPNNPFSAVSDVLNTATGTYDSALAVYLPIYNYQLPVWVPAYAAFDAALITYIGALGVYGSALIIYTAAGSPGSGGTYDTYQTAFGVYNTAINTFGTAAFVYGATLDTELPLAWQGAIPSLFDQAYTTYIHAANVTYLTAVSTRGAADYAWSQAGSPGSGPDWNTYQAAVSAYDAALNAYNAAQITFGTVLLVAVDYYNAVVATFAAAEIGYQAALDAYDSVLAANPNWFNTLADAIAFNASSPTLPNPYSSRNIV